MQSTQSKPRSMQNGFVDGEDLIFVWKKDKWKDPGTTKEMFQITKQIFYRKISWLGYIGTRYGGCHTNFHQKNVFSLPDLFEIGFCATAMLPFKENKTFN